MISNVEGSRIATSRGWKDYEGKTVGKKDLRQVQDHSQERRGARDLRQPQA
jgi:hypothetical protein